MSLKFGLNIKAKALNGARKPAPAKRKPIFDDDGEEHDKGKRREEVAAEVIDEFNFDDSFTSGSKSAGPPPPKKSKLAPSEPPTLKRKPKDDDPTSFAKTLGARQAEKKAQEAIQEDPSIYDYDAAYDALHAGTAAKAAAEREDALQRRPKYMTNLFESAEVRKKDQLRAQDKLLQREREAEGDEFADKEKFVTGAYKAQQEEVKRMEEEEKKRQDEEDAKKRKLGMQGFYKQMMLEQEQRHQEAMEAAAQALKEGTMVGAKPDVEEEKAAAEIAKELNEKGQNVILNDEGQVADKRQLLTAGLNVVARPKGPTVATSASNKPNSPQAAHQGRNPTQKGVRERQTRMIEEQLEQAAKRVADEEAAERERLEQASKSRKTESDISSAKERYLQRKREREAAAAKKA
ncbi:coiled-coil domain-containing protein 55-domain containing protein [Clohesyomyces aquaticus]|uniref:Coiled-coil domain-containing protein 55-domain containing protein n=1 Tax=Clohesyomyces aquaticus TaxID=1231657 RepID=A0A1Y1Z4H7_9PLEO|nr:coiled-coil domain-containing protein 55-domain containing protein [Clohesyomyces aquaticus]